MDCPVERVPTLSLDEARRANTKEIKLLVKHLEHYTEYLNPTKKMSIKDFEDPDLVKELTAPDSDDMDSVKQQVKILRDLNVYYFIFERILQPLICYVCNIEFRSLKDYNLHITGRPHQKFFSSFSSSGHISKENRARLAKRLLALPTIHSSLLFAEGQSLSYTQICSRQKMAAEIHEKGTQLYFGCRICGEGCKGPVQEHIDTPKHQFNAMRLIECSVCHLYFEQPYNLQSHCDTLLHRLIVIRHLKKEIENKKQSTSVEPSKSQPKTARDSSTISNKPLDKTSSKKPANKVVAEWSSSSTRAKANSNVKSVSSVNSPTTSATAVSTSSAASKEKSKPPATLLKEKHSVAESKEVLPANASKGLSESHGKAKESDKVRGSRVDEKSCETDEKKKLEPVAMEFVMPVTGFFCKLCARFYDNSKTNKEKHCSTPQHRTKAALWYLKNKMPLPPVLKSSKEVKAILLRREQKKAEQKKPELPQTTPSSKEETTDSVTGTSTNNKTCEDSVGKSMTVKNDAKISTSGEGDKVTLPENKMSTEDEVNTEGDRTSVSVVENAKKVGLVNESKGDKAAEQGKEQDGKPAEKVYAASIKTDQKDSREHRESNNNEDDIVEDLTSDDEEGVLEDIVEGSDDGGSEVESMAVDTDTNDKEGKKMREGKKELKSDISNSECKGKENQKEVGQVKHALQQDSSEKEGAGGATKRKREEKGVGMSKKAKTNPRKENDKEITTCTGNKDNKLEKEGVQNILPSSCDVCKRKMEEKSASKQDISDKKKLPVVLIYGDIHIENLNEFMKRKGLRFHYREASEVHVHGVKTKTIGQLIKQGLHDVKQLKPDVVLLHLGAFDLDAGHKPSDVKAHFLELIRKLHRELHVKFILVSEILHRHASHHSNPGFNEKLRSLNNDLKLALSSSALSCAKFCMLKKGALNPESYFNKDQLSLSNNGYRDLYQQWTGVLDFHLRRKECITVNPENSTSSKEEKHLEIKEPRNGKNVGKESEGSKDRSHGKNQDAGIKNIAQSKGQREDNDLAKSDSVSQSNRKKLDGVKESNISKALNKKEIRKGEQKKQVKSSGRHSEQGCTTVIAGHSFVSNLERSITKNKNWYSETVMRNFGVEDCKIHLKGVHGRTVNLFIKHDLSAIEKIQPDLLILELGSCDLTNPICRAEKVATALVDLAERIHRDFETKLIYICEILPRSHAPPYFADFNQKVKLCNESLERKLKNNTHCLFWKHTVGWSPTSEHFVTNEMNLTDDGNLNLYKSYRRAIRSGMKTLSAERAEGEHTTHSKSVEDEAKVKGLDKHGDQSNGSQHRLDKHGDQSKGSQHRLDKHGDQSKGSQHRLDKHGDQSKGSQHRLDKHGDQSKGSQHRLDKHGDQSKGSQHRLDKHGDQSKGSQHKSLEQEGISQGDNSGDESHRHQTLNMSSQDLRNDFVKLDEVGQLSKDDKEELKGRQVDKVVKNNNNSYVENHAISESDIPDCGLMERIGVEEDAEEIAVADKESMEVEDGRKDDQSSSNSGTGPDLNLLKERRDAGEVDKSDVANQDSTVQSKKCSATSGADIQPKQNEVVKISQKSLEEKDRNKKNETIKQKEREGKGESETTSDNNRNKAKENKGVAHSEDGAKNEDVNREENASGVHKTLSSSKPGDRGHNHSNANTSNRTKLKSGDSRGETVRKADNIFDSLSGGLPQMQNKAHHNVVMVRQDARSACRSSLGKTKSKGNKRGDTSSIEHRNIVTNSDRSESEDVGTHELDKQVGGTSNLFASSTESINDNRKEMVEQEGRSSHSSYTESEPEQVKNSGNQELSKSSCSKHSSGGVVQTKEIEDAHSKEVTEKNAHEGSVDPKLIKETEVQYTVQEGKDINSSTTEIQAREKVDDASSLEKDQSGSFSNSCADESEPRPTEDSSSQKVVNGAGIKDSVTGGKQAKEDESGNTVEMPKQRSDVNVNSSEELNNISQEKDTNSEPSVQQSHHEHTTDSSASVGHNKVISNNTITEQEANATTSLESESQPKNEHRKNVTNLSQSVTNTSSDQNENSATTSTTEVNARQSSPNSANEKKYKIVIAGHSTVCQLETFLDAMREVGIKEGFDSDNTKVDLCGAESKTIANFLEEDIAFVTEVKPDIVILQLGAIDLAEKKIAPEKVASNLITLIQKLHYELSVRLVVLGQTLARLKPSPTHETVTLLNKILERNVECIPYANFWKHSEMWNAQLNVYHPDGIHWNDVGLFILFKSFKEACTNAVNWIVKEDESAR